MATTVGPVGAATDLRVCDSWFIVTPTTPSVISALPPTMPISLICFGFMQRSTTTAPASLFRATLGFPEVGRGFPYAASGWMAGIDVYARRQLPERAVADI